MALDTDEHGRPEPPLNGSEWETLTGFLEFLRATFAWKCDGLSDEQLSRVLPPSSMTLAGMMKHLAYVEDHWFGRMLRDEAPREPWASVDWEAHPDWEWESALSEEPAAVRAQWEAAVARSRDAAADAFAAGGLETASAKAWPDGTRPSLRWILTHMIEEYGRHCGHADLIRESIDGVTGE